MDLAHLLRADSLLARQYRQPAGRQRQAGDRGPVDDRPSGLELRSDRRTGVCGHCRPASPPGRRCAACWPRPAGANCRCRRNCAPTRRPRAPGWKPSAPGWRLNPARTARSWTACASSFGPRLHEARLRLALARPLAEAALAGVRGQGGLAALSGWIPRRHWTRCGHCWKPVFMGATGSICANPSRGRSGRGALAGALPGLAQALRAAGEKLWRAALRRIRPDAAVCLHLPAAVRRHVRRCRPWRGDPAAGRRPVPALRAHGLGGYRGGRGVDAVRPALRQHLRLRGHDRAALAVAAARPDPGADDRGGLRRRLHRVHPAGQRTQQMGGRPGRRGACSIRPDWPGWCSIWAPSAAWSAWPARRRRAAVLAAGGRRHRCRWPATNGSKRRAGWASASW